MADEPEPEPQTLTFRCPPELEAVLPRPTLALLGLPDWFKSMPASAFSPMQQGDQPTVKICPPFIDAMTFGFLIPLVCDVRVEDGTFSWDFNPPHGAIASYSRSPLDFNDNIQVTGSPFFADDRFIIKFNNFWTFETPPGYSLLITHPFNRNELPFLTLTGLVDCDLYRDNFINFPAWWSDDNFEGVLPKGTPVAQCVPVRRDLWSAKFEAITGERVRALQETSMAVTSTPGVYRRRFRAPKR
jgi:hypothetical protein